MQDPSQHLAPAAAHAFLDALPEKIQRALVAYVEEINYPVEAVLEIVFTCVSVDADSHIGYRKLYLGRCYSETNIELNVFP
jgi:hypothetical protein